MFNYVIFDSRSLNCDLGYGLGDFSLVRGVYGYFNGPRKDQSYTYLPNL